MTKSKICWVIQKEKDSPKFVNEDLDDYDSLEYANFFETKQSAVSHFDPNHEEELVRRVRVTFELED